MTNLFKSIATVVLALTIFSCSNDTNIDETFSDSSSPLKSYTLSRDTNGNYSIQQELSNGVVSTINSNNGVNEISFDEDTQGKTTASKQKAFLTKENNGVKVDFITETTLKIPGIAAYDGQTSTTKGSANKITSYLESYDLISLGDGTYQLDFEVAPNTVVTFDYNEALSSYVIIMSEGDDNGVTTYSENYTKFEGEKLSITFIDQQDSTLNKGRANKSASHSIEIDGEDDGL